MKQHWSTDKLQCIKYDCDPDVDAQGIHAESHSIFLPPRVRLEIGSYVFVENLDPNPSYTGFVGVIAAVRFQSTNRCLVRACREDAKLLEDDILAVKTENLKLLSPPCRLKSIRVSPVEDMEVWEILESALLWANSRGASSSSIQHIPGLGMVQSLALGDFDERSDLQARVQYMMGMLKQSDLYKPICADLVLDSLGSQDAKDVRKMDNLINAAAGHRCHGDGVVDFSSMDYGFNAVPRKRHRLLRQLRMHDLYISGFCMVCQFVRMDNNPGNLRRSNCVWKEVRPRCLPDPTFKISG